MIVVIRITADGSNPEEKNLDRYWTLEGEESFMELFIFVILLIGLFGIIGNQYSGLRRMEKLQQTLDEINTGMKEMNDQRNQRSYLDK